MREERRDEVRARGEERAEVRGGEDVAERDVGLLLMLCLGEGGGGAGAGVGAEGGDDGADAGELFGGGLVRA